MQQAPPPRRADESGPLPQFTVDLSDADRTLEYRARGAAPTPGPDDRIDSPLPCLVAAALERARSFEPVTIREVGSTEEIDVDLAALSPADETAEAFMPRRKQRVASGWKIAAAFAVLTAAALLLGGAALLCERGSAAATPAASLR